MKVRFFYTETGSISIINWFAPEEKKPSHFPAKSSFAFFGVEPCLIEENPILEVCNLLMYLDRKWSNLRTSICTSQTCSSHVFCMYIAVHYVG